MEEFPKLESKRLRLVQIEPQYVKALFDILSKQEVTKYYGKENLKTIDEASELIENLHRLFNQKRCIRWGIIFKEENEFIGTVALNNLSIWNKKAEISYELDPTYWRQGITFEATKTVLDYAFTRLGLFRLGAVTFPENTASNNLLGKLGFKREGILRGYLLQDEKSHDAISHSILKPEWDNRREYEIVERIKYRDHLTDIIKRAERDGQFDYLPGKGKPIEFEQSFIANPFEKQLFKTMKENHVLPHWVRLSREIAILKEEVVEAQGRERRRKIKEINKKIKEYNYACPPSMQKNKMVE
ncbi:GNAT family N-acetyltransferase [Oceanobacillus bengalensis]|uniref:GNAT family N-acetyltransferase n=1 Tax=Oceanobacillus bengalensis TaxID=1435466 RepID=UPI0015FF1D49|nr:GNAT family N-acetyltransferase [Oceanobacillus bengalensis]